MTTAPVRVGIVGCGLLGGSVGLALVGVEGVEVVAATDIDAERAAMAVAVGAAKTALPDPRSVGAACDIVFVAVPVSAIASVALDVASAMPRGGIITDVGSVKAPVVAEIEAAVTPGVRFVGGHPMAGSEQDGIAAASADLFRQACWALTPTPSTDPGALRAVTRLVTATGAAPLSIDPVTHDHAVATISHLPQVAASALMNVAARRGEQAPPVLAMAAGGFRDVTRIAAGNPHVWEDILSENADAVREVLDAYIDELRGFRSRLSDRTVLHGMLDTARRARRSLPAIGIAVGDAYDVVVAVTDRPGVFAEVMTAVGEAGVNIGDVELRHSPEGGRGLLTLTVTGAESADHAVSVLSDRGYTVHRERVE